MQLASALAIVGRWDGARARCHEGGHGVVAMTATMRGRGACALVRAARARPGRAAPATGRQTAGGGGSRGVGVREARCPGSKSASRALKSAMEGRSLSSPNTMPDFCGVEFLPDFGKISIPF